MLKRPRDVFDTPSSSSPPMPPHKRQSVPASRTDASTSLPALPRRAPWVSSIPHDSPSNPFGLNRSLRALALPRPTGFAKHTVLRMQVVSQVEGRARSRRLVSDAPYRIVQVPLSYSFRLFHELILFLFASDASLRVRRPRKVFSPSLYPRQPPPPPRKRKSELQILGESPKKEEGHLFEVLNDVSVYANTYRPGVIKPGSGKLYARLSSTRERKLFSGKHQDEDDDVFGNPVPKPCTSTDTDEEEDWDWEPEDDFDLGNVWTDGPDLKKGIIYHHTQSTSIHITVFTGRIPDRKGSGNTPHVFFAHGGTNGAVRISNVVPGPMPTEKEIEANMELKSSSRRKGKEKENKKKSIFPALGLTDDYDEVDDLDDGEEASDQQRDRWNDHDAFQRFLAREAARERAMRKNLDEPPTPAPAPSSQNARANMLFAGRSPTRAPPSHSYAARPPPHPTHAAHPYAQPSASSSTSSLAPSSPSTLPILLPSSDFDGDGEAWSDVDYDVEPSSSADPAYDPDYDPDATQRQPHPLPRGRSRAPVYEIGLPLQTPFPASPRVRRRVARVSKRMVRQTSKGLSEMDASDDEAEAEEKDELDPGASQEQESPQAQERGEEAEAEQEQQGSDDTSTSSEESEESAGEDRTEVQKRPVVALRGPNVFFAPPSRPVAPQPAQAYEYDSEEYGEYEEPERLVDDDDSDDDEEFWEDGEVEFEFVHQDDDSDDEV